MRLLMNCNPKSQGLNVDDNKPLSVFRSFRMKILLIVFGLKLLAVLFVLNSFLSIIGLRSCWTAENYVGNLLFLFKDLIFFCETYNHFAYHMLDIFVICNIGNDFGDVLLLHNFYCLYIGSQAVFL